MKQSEVLEQRIEKQNTGYYWNGAYSNLDDFDIQKYIKERNEK